jgi:hypothetical protein
MLREAGQRCSNDAAAPCPFQISPSRRRSGRRVRRDPQGTGAPPRWHRRRAGPRLAGWAGTLHSHAAAGVHRGFPRLRDRDSVRRLTVPWESDPRLFQFPTGPRVAEVTPACVGIVWPTLARSAGRACARNIGNGYVHGRKGTEHRRATAITEVDPILEPGLGRVSYRRML